MRSALVNTGFAGPYTGPGLGTIMDIYAARLDASGNLIDTTPIVISQAGYIQSSPVVGWNGQNWLVAWSTERATDRYANDIMAVRVSPDGRVLDNPAILLAAAPTSIDSYVPWAVSSDGTNWAVVWRGLDVAAGIFTIEGARVAPNGVVLDPGGKRLRRDSSNSAASNADLAFAGDEYLMTWRELGGSGGWVVRAERLSPALDVIGSVFQVNLNTPSNPLAPKVATNGDSFFVVWSEEWTGAAHTLMGTRVSHAGAVLDPSGITLTPTSGYTSFRPDVCWDGTNYIAAYNRQATFFEDDLYATRVSANGTVLDPNGILVSDAFNSQLNPGIAPVPGGGAQVLWTDFSNGGSTAGDILAASISNNGAVTPRGVVTVAAPNQPMSRIAAGGPGYLTVYVSETASETRILAQRLDAKGTALDATPLVLAGGSLSLTNPGVAWNGSEFLVVWDDISGNAGRGQVYAKRVLADGTVIDVSPIGVLPGLRPAVAALADTFLVTSDDAPSNPQQRFPFAVRVSAAGVVLDAPLQVGTNFSYSTSVAAVGNRWLVAWERHPTHDNPSSSINGAFVEAAGTTSGSFGISSGSNHKTPDVASAGASALVVWHNGNILGRRINADGTLLDSTSGLLISGAANEQSLARAAWDGAQYLVTWVDHRNFTYPLQPVDDVFAARVDLSGSVLDLNGFPIAAAAARGESRPALAAANGTTIFAYSAFQNDAPYASYRINLRRYPFNQDYSVSSSPGFATLAPGASASFEINVTPVGGFSDSVTLQVEDLPPGVTASFNPATVNPGATATLNVTTSGSTPVDRYPVTVIASSGARQSWATILLNVTNAPAPPRFNVIDLGTFGGISSEAWGLNEAGDVVGWANLANGQKRAFRYSNGALTDLGTLGGIESIAYGINSAGDIVGSSKIAAGTQRAFRWSGGTMQDLGTIDGSLRAATARAINNAGQIVGYSDYQDGSTEAFIWNNGSMSPLGRLGSTSYAFAVNASGEAAGWGQLSNGAARAYRYSNGAVQNLGIILASPFDGSYAYGMNDAGLVVGSGTYGSTTDTHAALFNGGAVQDLGTLGGTRSRAWAINGANQIVGHSTNSGAVQRAFLYENSLVDLNSLISPASSWVLSEARAINNAGQIVGSGVINGATHAFLLNPSTGPRPITAVSALSRKIHGSAGAFDIALPVSGAPGIESRTGGAGGNHQVIIALSESVWVSSARLDSQTAFISNVTVQGNQAIVDLNGLANGQTINVTLSGVTNGLTSADITVPIRFLTGDTNANGVVNGTDVSQTKAAAGQTVTAANFRADVNANGTITASDLALVKSLAGSSAGAAKPDQSR